MMRASCEAALIRFFRRSLAFAAGGGDFSAVLQAAGLPLVEWITSSGLVPYRVSVEWMESRVAGIASGAADEAVWLLEHPPLYTSGTSTGGGEIAERPPFPVFKTGRGGRATYHGPGQRVIYLMLDLDRRQRDVRRFVESIENWLIASLADLGVEGFAVRGRTGVWVSRTGGADQSRDVKVAAIGIRLRRWISFHGASLNIDPNLDHYSAIVPCGIHDCGVGSLAQIAGGLGMPEVDAVLRSRFDQFLGERVWRGSNSPASVC